MPCYAALLTIQNGDVTGILRYHIELRLSTHDMLICRQDYAATLRDYVAVVLLMLRAKRYMRITLSLSLFFLLLVFFDAGCCRRHFDVMRRLPMIFFTPLPLRCHAAADFDAAAA